MNQIHITVMDMETQDTLYTLQTASYLPDGTGGRNEQEKRISGSRAVYGASGICDALSDCFCGVVTDNGKSRSANERVNGRSDAALL